MERFFVFFETRLTTLRDHINSTSEWKILLYLFSFFIGWRLIALQFIKKSGDAVWKWSFLRYFHETGIWFPQFPDHHQGRWASNLPTLGLMKIFGAEPWVYYVVPLLTGLGVSFLCYLIARKMSDKFSGMLAFLLSMFFASIINESNQLMPLLPSAFWVLCAVVLCFKHFTSSKHLWLFLLAGISLGFSWGCKVTAVYWCVAFGLFLLFTDTPGKSLFRIWKIRVGWDIILLTLGFLLVFIPETLLLNHFFDVKGGRISMILSGHLAGQPRVEASPSILEYIFSIHLPLKVSGKLPNFLPKVVFFITGITVMILWLKKKKNSLLHRFFAFTFVVAYLFHSYMIVGIDPLRYPERPLGRYFIILSLFALVATASGWSDLTEFLRSKVENRKYYILLTSFTVVLCLVSLLPYTINETFLHNNNISRIIVAEKGMRTAESKDLPVLALLRDCPNFFYKEKFDRKVAKLLVTFWGPTRMIPDFFSATPLKLVHDNEGIAYNYLWGGMMPPAGEKVQCAVVSKRDIKIMEVQF